MAASTVERLIMTGNTEQHVFVVDDELKVLEAIGETLGSLDIEATCFVPK